MPKKTANTLQKIYSSALKFLVPLTPKETYKTIVKEAMYMVGADDGLIMLSRGEKFDIVYASSDEASQVNVRARGFTYTALQKNEPFIIYPSDFAPVHPQIARQGVKAAIFIPLSYQENAIGVLALRSYVPKKLTDEELDGLKLFGSLASLAIRKTQLYSDTQEALDARDLFIALAAHELRTPLTTITVYIHLLEKKILRGEVPHERWIKSITQETSRLTSLVNELLQVHQIEKKQLKYFFKKYKLSDIIYEAVSSFTLTHPAQLLKITDSLNGGHCIIHADKQKILQVISNLLQNAAKFSPPETPIILGIEEKGKQYIVKISDKGEGIEKKELAKIFDQFYKAKTNRKDGMGLGLFLTKTIMESHGGDISIDSIKNKGTTVTITFPKNT